MEKETMRGAYRLLISSKETYGEGHDIAKHDVLGTISDGILKLYSLRKPFELIMSTSDDWKKGKIATVQVGSDQQPKQDSEFIMRTDQLAKLQQT